MNSGSFPRNFEWAHGCVRDGVLLSAHNISCENLSVLISLFKNLSSLYVALEFLEFSFAID